MNAEATTPEQSLGPLHAYLSNRDVPCANCGVNLRGVTEDACPACGEELSLERLKRGWAVRRPLFLSIATVGVTILGALTFLALMASFGGVVSSYGGMTQLVLLAALAGEFLLVWLLVNEPNDTFEQQRRPFVLWLLIGLIAFTGIGTALGAVFFAVSALVRAVVG